MASNADESMRETAVRDDDLVAPTFHLTDADNPASQPAFYDHSQCSFEFTSIPSISLQISFVHEAFSKANRFRRLYKTNRFLKLSLESCLPGIL